MFPSALHAATATSRPHTPRGQWSFRPRLRHSNPCKKVPLRPVLVHLNLKSCIVTAMLLHLFCQWEGVKVFQTCCLTFLGRVLVWPRLGESEFDRPICQVWFNLSILFHSESFWSAKGESELWKQSAATKEQDFLMLRIECCHPLPLASCRECYGWTCAAAHSLEFFVQYCFWEMKWGKLACGYILCFDIFAVNSQPVSVFWLGKSRSSCCGLDHPDYILQYSCLCPAGILRHDRSAIAATNNW